MKTTYNTTQLKEANKVLKELLRDSWFGTPTRKRIKMICTTIDEIIEEKEKQENKKIQESFDEADDFRFSF